MRRNLWSATTLVLSVALAFVSGRANRADAGLIYGSTTSGSNGVSDFYSIDSTTGAATLIGSIGFQRVSGMDFNSSGVLYATAERDDGSDTPVLITINLATGAGTEVGPTGLSGAISDLSFRADGVLYAFDAANDPTHSLATIDTTTGSGTDLGSTGLSVDGGNGMTFSSGILYHIARDDGLHTLDQTTSAASTGTPVTYDAGGFVVNAMDLDTDNGLVYASVQVTSTQRYLGLVDFSGASVTKIGDTIAGLDAIAILSGPVAVPEPTTLALFASGGLVFAASRLRRRRRP